MFRPCEGCARRRERMKALWHAVRGGTLRGDSVMLSGEVAMICLTRRLNAAHWLQALPLRRIWLLTRSDRRTTDPSASSRF
jgi:hypothetical protein